MPPPIIPSDDRHTPPTLGVTPRAGWVLPWQHLALRTAIVVMGLLAAVKLADEMMRLVWRPGFAAAVDLRFRYNELHAWFAGLPVYRDVVIAAYPPATYVLLWPLLGWLTLPAARWLWAATTVLALAWMTRIVVRESGATGAWQRAFAALMLVAMNQTGVAVGNGQLILHVLPPLVAAVLLFHRGGGSWPEDLVASVGVIFALIKITITVPFLWLVLFTPARNESGKRWPWRLRPASLVAAGYVALTLIGASFQDGSLWLQLREWMHVARTVAEVGGDYANVHGWLRGVGLERLMLPATAALFGALGLWLFANRGADLWLRLGVVALVARFWTYHRLYDDVLVILAFVATLRVALAVGEDAGRSTRRTRTAAAGLLGISMLVMLLPARLETAPHPWRLIFTNTHTVTWLAMLGFLAWRARGWRRALLGASAQSASR